MTLRKTLFPYATAASVLLHALILFTVFSPLHTMHSSKSASRSMSVHVSNVVTPTPTKTRTQPKTTTAKKEIAASQETLPLPSHSVEEVSPTGPTMVADAHTEYAPAPDYPRMAKLRGLFGVVALRLEVNGQGLPMHVSVIKSSGHDILDQAALEALKRWRFTPTDHSTELAFYTEKTVEFRLED